jgi:hypothetical protein
MYSLLKLSILVNVDVALLTGVIKISKHREGTQLAGRKCIWGTHTCRKNITG